MTHEEAIRSIDRHFARRLSVADESALRAHLPGCAACARRYERHLLVARLDPRAASAEDRLAHGLGLRSSRVRTARPLWGGSVAAALAVTALILVVRARAPHERGADDGLGARGARGVAELWVYRVTDGAPPRLASGPLAARDELAFAYSNPAGKAFLAIFGADEHGHVYWYYPAWPVGTSAPAAVPARAGPGPHELSEAVRQPLDGAHLDLYAIFSDESVDVTTLEGAVARRMNGGELPLPRADVVVRRSFEVTR